MKICACIITYHPDIDRLQKNIDAVMPQVDKLYLISNDPEDVQLLSELNIKGDYNLIENEENLGIAAALNQALTAAHSEGFKWILTLDQDSICRPGLVDKLFQAGQQYDNAAMISPQVIERGKLWDDKVQRVEKNRTTGLKRTSGTGSSGSTGRTDSGGGTNSRTADIEDVTYCITSGTLTSTEAVKRVGGWNERLFIDEVDREICIRLRYIGCRLLRVNTVQMHHEFGISLSRRRIFFKTYEYRNHPPQRVYYQMRNMIYMIRKYGADYKPHPVWQAIRPFFTFFVKFVCEPQRLARLSAFIRGYCAGWAMKL